MAAEVDRVRKESETVTIPTNLLGKLQGIDIDGILDLFKRTRNTGRTVLDQIQQLVHDNPELKAIRNDLERILGPLFNGPSDEEIEKWRIGWTARNAAKSRDLPSDPEPPPPPPPQPPPTTEFPFGEERSSFHPLQWNEAHLLVPGTYRIYRFTSGARWVVDRIGEPLRDVALWRVDPVQE
jgi:hypothetical protein